MQRPRVTQIETHVTHACSFECEGCTHFSQEKMKGQHTVESFRAEIGPWSKRLLPHNFLLLGGEPTLNPNLTQICQAARDLWSGVENGKHLVTMMLVTNGSHLHKHPELPEVLKRCKIHLDVSVHHDAPEYLAKLEEVKDWAAKHDLSIRWRESFRDWTAYYRGEGANAEPFADNDPQASWNHCASRWCFNLHEGKLFKCPMSAYIKMHVAKFPQNKEKWLPYLGYNGLEADCSEPQLTEFIHRRCESICGMCPANPQPLVKSNPMRRVNLV